MTCDDLKRFMEEEQGEEEVTSGFCQNVVERFEPSTEGTEKGLLSVDGEQKKLTYIYIVTQMFA